MRSIALAALFILASFAGCSVADDSQKETEVGDSYFKPNQQVSKPGDTMTFTSVGVQQHTVTVHRPPDPQGQFIKDTILNPGESTTLTFDKTGVYHVFCKFHSRGQQGDYMSNMTMQVTIT